MVSIVINVEKGVGFGFWLFGNFVVFSFDRIGYIILVLRGRMWVLELGFFFFRIR